ncbi:segregation and condensation protein A [Deferribacter abyssi]|uniref:segregation and condensation protein A n=1 Tax=Deferribacter abyssi TaxID=213806 RepID=UPI003C14574E
MSDLLEVRLENFEGPLDLLIHLIYKNEMNIYDISISVIADQFINTIKQMEEMDIEIASDFIQMASYLVYLKSKMLLPQNKVVDEEMDVEEEKFLFTQRLIEYSFYKDVAEILRDKESKASMCMTREDTIFLEKDFEPIGDAYTIARHFFDLLKKEGERTITLERKSLDINTIIKKIKSFVLERREVFWSEIIKKCIDKKEVAVSFLAILELIKLKVIIAVQESNFSNFMVKVKNG